MWHHQGNHGFTYTPPAPVAVPPKNVSQLLQERYQQDQGREDQTRIDTALSTLAHLSPRVASQRANAHPDLKRLKVWTEQDFIKPAEARQAKTPQELEHEEVAEIYSLVQAGQYEAANNRARSSQFPRVRASAGTFKQEPPKPIQATPLVPTWEKVQDTAGKWHWIHPTQGRRDAGVQGSLKTVKASRLFTPDERQYKVGPLKKAWYDAMDMVKSVGKSAEQRQKERQAALAQLNNLARGKGVQFVESAGTLVIQDLAGNNLEDDLDTAGGTGGTGGTGGWGD